jgi:methyltransferase (TIGR00027 family)
MFDKFTDISDTAFWIAGYRAQESGREDAVFNDFLAEKLAGERGRQMVAVTPGTEQMAFAMVVRTAAIDRLVLIAVENGVDTVINLGAGLDTRPYRLPLPANLNWIEVDFPNLIAYKNTVLAEDKPVCHLARIAADLSDITTRQKLFTELGSRTKKALVITEGVIAYLSSAEASQLSKDIYALPAFKYWVQDYTQGMFRKLGQSLNKTGMLKNTPFRFGVKNPLSFFGRDGWKICEDLHILDEAGRIGRPLPLKMPWSLLIRIFPKWIRAAGNRTRGIVMFEKI